MAAPGQYFVDFHPDNVDPDNPKGVGDTFGTLVKPFGQTWDVQYCDGELLSVDRSALKCAPQIGDIIQFKGKFRELVWYDEAGSHWVPVEDPNAKLKRSKQVQTPSKTTTKTRQKQVATNSNATGGGTNGNAESTNSPSKPKAKGKDKPAGPANNGKAAASKTSQKEVATNSKATGGGTTNGNAASTNSPSKPKAKGKDKPAGAANNAKAAASKTSQKQVVTNSKATGGGTTNDNAATTNSPNKPKAKAKDTPAGVANNGKAAASKTTKKKVRRKVRCTTGGRRHPTLPKKVRGGTSGKVGSASKAAANSSRKPKASKAAANSSRKPKAKAKDKPVGAANNGKAAARKTTKKTSRSKKNGKVGTRTKKKVRGGTSGKPGAKWLRDPVRTALRPRPAANLSEALTGLKDGLIGIFAERVMRQYASQQKSAIHLHYEEVLRYSVTQVFQQVRPATDKPYDGDVDIAVEEMIPIAIKTFEIR